jgi:thiol-disulfide isomerase/thioredoxin
MIAGSGASNGFRSVSRIVLLAALAVPTIAARGDAPATAPTTAPAPATSAPTTSSAQRGTQQIMEDIDAAGKQLEPIFGSAATLTDPAKRTAAAPKAIPVLKHMLALTDELNQQDEQGKMIGKQIRGQLLPVLLTFGDDQAQADATKAAAGSDPDAARQGKTAILMSSWWKASADAATQTKLLADATALAKSDSESPEIGESLMALSRLGAATPDLANKMQEIITTNMKGDFVDQIKQDIEGQHKMEALVGKPFTLTGSTVDGAAFNMDQMKGKVILVDFWATWSDPSKRDLPRLEKVYGDFHSQGLEVIGVSNDMMADDLKKFVSADPAMQWPELFDAKAAGQQEWNPITTGFGVGGIPTMFLIDKKGICRSVTAHDDFETEIPKLIAEQ